MALTTITSAGIAADAVTSAKIADGAITNADVNNTAAIAQSKLALDIVNANVNASAAIAQSKLAAIAADALSGNVIDGGTISNFASTGIDDNADALAVTITSAEKVGLGVTDPDEVLEVNGAIHSGNRIDIYKGGNVTKSATMGANDDIGLTGLNASDFVIKTTEATSAFGIATSGASDVDCCIADTGSVGISTIAPTGLLHVKSGGASTTPFRVERSGGSGDELAVNMQGDNRMWVQMYQAGTEKIRFDVGSPSFITDKLTIGSNTTATTTLLVSGDVKTTGQAYFADTTLSFDATQDWNLSTNQVCTLTLTANTTFDAPTNMVDGAFYSILMIQDGTGSRTASWNTVFKWAAATAPTLTTTAAAKDIFVFRSDGTNMYEVGRQLNVS